MWARPCSTSTTSQETSRSTTNFHFVFFFFFPLSLSPPFFLQMSNTGIAKSKWEKAQKHETVQYQQPLVVKTAYNKHRSQKSTLSDVCPRLARVKNHPCGSRPCDKVESRCKIGVTRWRHTHLQRFVFKPSVPSKPAHTIFALYEKTRQNT